MTNEAERGNPVQRSVMPGALAWLAGALALLLASCVRVFPALAIARMLSDDGIISDAFAAQLARSQWTLAVLSLAAWPLLLIPEHTERAIGFVLKKLPGSTFFTGTALLAFVATWTVQAWLFDGIPHVTDAISHLFQAKIFALGRLWAAAPPCFEHFFQFNIYITRDGRWMSAYPPGHALTLLLALKLHALALYGPVCTTGSLVACTFLVRRFFGDSFSRVFALLFAISPMSLLIGGSFMSHVSLLLCASSALALGVRGIDRAVARRPAFACFAGSGFLMGMAALIRPQDVVFFVPPVLIGAAMARHQVASSLRVAIPGIAAGLALPLAAQLFWNDRVFGSAFALGYGRTDVGSLTPVLVPVMGFTDSFSVTQAVHQLVWTLSRLDAALLGWPFALPFACLALVGRQTDRRDIVAVLTVGLVTLFYFAYGYYGREYEARFYSAFVPFLLVLVLRGVQRLDVWISRGAFVPVFAVVLTLHALAYYWPVHIVPEYGHDYEQASPVVARAAKEAGLKRALVLVDSTGMNEFRYSSAFLLNDPMLEGDVVYARDLPAGNDCLFQAFPGRAVYRFVPDDAWTSGRFDPVAAPH